MIETYYRILKHDPEGKLVKDSGLIPSRSYVIQFLELIGAILESPGTVQGTDANEAEVTIYYPAGQASYHGRVDAAAGQVIYGVVVGTNAGTTAEDNENFKLDTKILHSAVGEANKLNYMAVTMIKAREVGPNVDFDITRAFLNESGGTITVKEIGILARYSSAAYAHLLLRDVVTDEDVEDGYTLTVVYTLRTTV